MSNIMILTTIDVGEKDTRFLSDHYEFIENKKIDEGTFSFPQTLVLILMTIILQKVIIVLLKQWSVIRFTVFTRMKKPKKMIGSKMFGLKNIGI